MAVTTIPWGDGSGDNIYLTYPSASGDQTVEVSSDANTGSARSKVITFMAGNAAKTLTVNQEVSLPYTVLEYIQTDGIAYIDTGIKGNAPMSFAGTMLPVAPASGNSYFMGCRKDSANTRFFVFVVGSGKTAGFGYYSSTWATALDISASINNGTPLDFHTVFRSGTNRVGVKQQGDSSFTDYTRTVNQAVATNKNITVFALNSYSGVSVCESGTRCYGIRIYSSANYTNLVFDGIPVLYSGEYGLWDKVSDSFFGNAAASGAFTGA